MLVIGIVLLILGYFLAVPILETLGIVLIVIGAVLALLGGFGHPVAGSRHYF